MLSSNAMLKTGIYKIVIENTVCLVQIVQNAYAYIQNNLQEKVCDAMKYAK